MCGYINPTKTQTKFVILMHPKEFKKVKNNTGFFTHQSLSNSHVYVGIDFSNHSAINEIIATHESYILFPSVDALNLSETNPKRSDKPLAIFIIDSTWACTRKIFTQSSNLRNLRHLSFVTTRTSQYEIKEQPKSNYLSTIESTLVVLELLNKWKIEETPTSNLDGFLEPFLEMVKYQKKLLESSKTDSVRFKRHNQ